MSILNPVWHITRGCQRTLPAWNIGKSTKVDENYEEIIGVCKTLYSDEVEKNEKDPNCNNIKILKVDNNNNTSGKIENTSKGQPIIWLNVIMITIFHIISVYSAIAYIMETKILSVIWGFVVGGIGGFGVTAGVHRLWAHRCYKATLPLQILLIICYSVSGQNDIYQWVRDHRVHHKFSETDADPHNSNRGFFFSHVGWLMQKKHPEVTRKGKMIDMRDIEEDALLMFHTRYFLYFKLLFCFIIPIIIPVYLWGESWKIAILSQAFIRYILNLNFTWSVNSVAHIWGMKPFNKNIKPAQNIGVSIVAMGEGYHNYHHVFPWDYRAAEHGNYTFNVTTMWLDLFEKLGLAYDLKKPSQELIWKVAKNRGDGSYIPEVSRPKK